jgi:hypothetical protein
MGTIKNTYRPKESNIKKLKDFKIKLNTKENGGKFKDK